MKPRKSWQPAYRFGGNRADAMCQPELGRYTNQPVIKTKKAKKK